MAKNICSLYAILLLSLTLGDLMATVVGDRCKTDLGVCPAKNGCNAKCSKIHEGGQGICENNHCMCNFDCKICDVVLSDQLLGCTDISCTSECVAKYPGKGATGYCVSFGQPYTNCHCQYQC
ncbi:hypothetical protein AAZX31_09G053200 [Glycine max]